jgi:hypothetical protein
MENILELTDLNYNELIEIDGGHHGAAYDAGQYTAKAMLGFICIMACIALL